MGRRRGGGTLELVEVVAPGWRLPAMLVVIVLTLALAMWSWAVELTGRHLAEDLPRVVLPSVANLDVATAMHRLDGLGVVVGVLNRPNESVPAGTAFGQEPVAGAKVELGDRVSILVSDGPAGIFVPQLAGQQVVDAMVALQANGLGAAVTTTHDEFVPTGQVIASQPGAGGRIAMGGTVKLTISGGPAPRLVPAVVGTDINTALVAIGRAGLTVGPITRTYRPDQPPGQVIESSPAAGSEVPREMPVKLTVTGPAPSVAVPSFTGLLQTTAQTVAQARDLRLSIIYQPVAVGDPTAGRIVAQGLPPYADVPTDSTVEVTVAVPG